MAMMFLLSAPFVQAGIWGNFWTAIGNTVENYNADMLATGDAVNASLKEGKVMEAFTAYEKNIQIVGDHALENSKAVYKALKDIVLWIPRQIKKVWDKFVAILQKIRDQLAAMNQPGALTGNTTPSAPTTKASKSWMDAFDVSNYDPNGNTSQTTADSALVTNDLGDGWVKMFNDSPDFAAKLKTFSHYKGHTQTMNLYMNGLEKEHFKALDPNFTKVTNECAQIEGLLLEELSKDLEEEGTKLETLTSSLNGMSENEAKATLGTLVKKVSRRARMLQLSGNASVSKTIKQFNKAVKKKNLD